MLTKLMVVCGNRIDCHNCLEYKHRKTAGLSVFGFLFLVYRFAIS